MAPRVRGVRARLGLERRKAPQSTVGATMLDLSRTGPAALEPSRADPHGPLRIAAVVPSFRRGGGGHRTIVRLLAQMQRGGHEVSIWLDDHEALHAGQPEESVARSFASFFDAEGLPLRLGFDAWRGADVVLATGWQTVPRALMLPGTSARAYLVQDHEPDFYPASVESTWAAATYRAGFHCIAASRWLAQLLRERYGASASHFDLGVDHSVYRPRTGTRREDLVIFYARSSTARRAVPLGIAGLAELAGRRRRVEVELFGDAARSPVQARRGLVERPRRLGILPEEELASLYARATIGIVFSLTNPSLVGLEMMASGLPCIELASEAMIATFGKEGPLQLVDPDPLELCCAIERLLDDRVERDRLSSAGVALMSGCSWEHAARQCEEGLRQALFADRAG
jgi:O-antigen biosynthesis protein